ncbi:MAG: hypothetical protein H6Q13_3503 [Bacteroidetes bacterium]|nr:hypothetical protein [Bacteroidota bacterium]
MLKIAHVYQLKSISGLPAEVINTIHEAVSILDNEYGEDRHIDNGYGGYVLVIESMEELTFLKELHLDIESTIPEYVDVINCNNGQVYTSTLILLGSDFGIVVVMPLAFIIFTYTLLL